MRPIVTVTFDNGPDPEVTPLVLDVLRHRRVRASFFVIGSKLALPAARRIATRAWEEGHWIGNHSWSHGDPLGLRRDPGHAAAEIGRTQALLGRLAHPAKLFRPVGGGGKLGPHLLSRQARCFLAAGGYSIITWTTVPGDWHDPEGWPERALAACLAAPRPVLVLHDINQRAMRHLDAVLGRLADSGAIFVQDFPDQVVPMRCGIASAALDALTMPDDAAPPAPTRAAVASLCSTAPPPPSPHRPGPPLTAGCRPPAG